MQHKLQLELMHQVVLPLFEPAVEWVLVGFNPLLL